MAKPESRVRKSHNPRRQRRTHKVKMRRIILCVPDNLIQLADEAAENSFTNRSDIIRTALRWYLRPEKREFADAEEIFQTMERRKAIAGMNKMMQDAGLITRPKRRKKTG